MGFFREPKQYLAVNVRTIYWAITNASLTIWLGHWPRQQSVPNISPPVCLLFSQNFFIYLSLLLSFSMNFCTEFPYAPLHSLPSSRTITIIFSSSLHLLNNISYLSLNFSFIFSLSFLYPQHPPLL